MKKLFKFCLSLAGMLLTVGIVSMAAGAVMGGRGASDRYFRENWSGSGWEKALEQLEKAVDHTELLGHHRWELLDRIPAHRDPEYLLPDVGGTYPISLDGLTAIEVDVDCADILIQEGESASIAMSWNLSNYAISHEIEDECLKITSESWGSNKLPDNFHIDCKVILTLPSGTELEKLALSTDMGDVDVDTDLAVKEAELSSELGDVTVQRLLADTLEADTDLGNVELYLPGRRADYTWELMTDLGELAIDGEVWSSGMGELTERGGSGKNSVEASSSLGNVQVYFGA